MTVKSIYQFKITLAGLTPPIWRRVLVSDQLTLRDLHKVIQNSFDWADYHLYSFEHLGARIDDENPKMLSKKLCKLQLGEKSKINYIYDFGDCWEHKIVLEKIVPNDGSKNFPYCIAGKRAAPPEDCGGIWGYQDKLVILADEDHPEHMDILDGMGDDFDPDAFDIKAVNEQLKNMAPATV